METRVVPFAVHSYQSRSLPWSAQRVVNWYAKVAPGAGMTKSPVVLLPRFAKSRFGTLSGNCRGLYEVAGVLYGVYGGSLYSIASTGVATNIGAIGGANPVTWADNGAQICISANPEAYVYTIATATFEQIVDADFSGSSSVAFIDGFFVHSTPNASGEFQWSDTSNALSYDALNFATAETNGDELKRIIQMHQELWEFGDRTVEVWATTGSALSAFERLQSVSIERGCAAKFSIAKADNTVIWIAEDRTVRKAMGYNPIRISTDAIDKILTDAVDLENVRAFSHVEDGHTFYTMTSVNNGWTFSFDMVTGLWAERWTFNTNWWDAFSAVNVYGSWIVGDSSGGLFKLRPDIYQDDGNPIRFEVTSAPFFQSSARIGLSRFQILIESGIGLSSGQGSDPQIMLQWSDDGGRTWSNEHWRSMGAIGEYRKRATWRQGGRFYERIWRAAVTDPIKPVLIGAYADIEMTPP